MTANRNPPASDGQDRHGFLVANNWLIARRLAQLGFFLLFATGPWLGVWIAKGNLASSLTLDTLPLTDPLILLQSLLARHRPEASAILGAAIVLAAYLLLGGRLYCSWVCPINPVTDFAAWARRRLGIETDWKVKPETRLWLLGAILLASAATGTIAFELINPITTLYRGLLFGVSWGLVSVAAIFLFDLVRGQARLVRPRLPRRRLLRSAQSHRAPARLRTRPRALRRLHGLLRRLPRDARHLAGPQRRTHRGWSNHHVSRLHRVWPLHRRLPRARVPLHASLRPAARRARTVDAAGRRSRLKPNAKALA